MASKLVLIVDDEPIIQKLCATILRIHGFASITEGNGVDGLNTYRERHREICWVLSDVSMPIMDGVQMVRKVFDVSSRANVILMSGANLGDLISDDVRRLCSVIQKPFGPAQLIEAVDKCLKYDSERYANAASA